MPCNILVFSTLLGVFPMTGMGRFSVNSSIYSFITISALMYVESMRNETFLKEYFNSVKVGELIEKLHDFRIAVIVILVFGHLCKVIIKRKSLEDVLKLCGPLDEGIPLVFSLGHLLSNLSLALVKHSQHYFYLWNTAHLNILILTVALQFCGFLNRFYKEFESMYAQMKRNKLHNLSLLIDKHAHLMNYLKIIDEIYSHQILFACLLFGEGLIICLLMAVIQYVKYGFYTVNFLLTTSLIGQELFPLVYMSFCCQRTMDRANEFNIEFFHLLKDTTLCYRSNEKVLLYVKMRQTINFTAGGYFQLGHPFLTSIAATVATYLVILIQLM